MRRFYLGLLLVLVMAVLLLGCGGGKQTQNTLGTASGNVFVTGQDAPLPAVLAFQINIDTLTLSNGATTVTLDSPGTVEFSRLLGLRTLLSLSSVPAGTYTSVQVTFSNPTITYLDMTTTPPSTKTVTGTLSGSTPVVTLNPPLVVAANGLAGLTFHFDLAKSLADTVVTPVIQIRALILPNDDDAEIDELRGGVVSVDTANKLFLMQRPNGRQITVHVDNNTQWQGNDSLSTIAPPTTVEVSGKIQADGSLLADAVEVLTHDKAFLGGLILNVNPATGPANQITMLVRSELPAIPGIPVPGTTTLNLGSNTNFVIRNFNLPVSAFLFNDSMLVLGQRIGVQGVLDNSTTPASIDVARVALRRQGLDGIPSNVQVNSGNNGTFQLTNNGLFGVILGGTPLAVMTSNMTYFNTPNHSLQDVASASKVRVVGLILKDGSGNPVLVAGYVATLP